MSAPPRSDLATVLTWMRDGESFLAEQLAGLNLRAASLLPGWTRAQLASHLASNARALGNLLDWARTGEETPMYPSLEVRDWEIAEGAAHPDDEIRATVAQTAKKLSAAVSSLPEHAWAARVRSALGRDIPASEVPWLRVREVWIHAVDLGEGVWFDALPVGLVDELISEVCGTLSTRKGCPAVVVATPNRGRTWSIGDVNPDTVWVESAAADLLGWVVGRRDCAHPARIGAPSLPRWI